MVSHPETGSDSSIGSDRDRGRDIGNRVDNGKNLSCKSPSFHFFSVLAAFNFHHFSSLYLLILLNLGLILLFEFFLWNFNFHMQFI